MSAGQPVQLPLGIKLRDEATFASYYPGPNATVLAATRAFASLQSAVPECCLFLWGTEGTGRTHLLQAACHALADEGGLAMYLPLDELADEGPLLLEGMESVDLLCLDKLEAVVGRPDWEEALFHLYNRLREQGGRLLVAAAAAPRALGLKLPDLESRLGWGLVFQLQPPQFEGHAL